MHTGITNPNASYTPTHGYTRYRQVNKAWAGLGYYRRAKMLHLGAQKVLADYGGSLPRTAKELKDLPGIGPYTAGVRLLCLCPSCVVVCLFVFRGLHGRCAPVFVCLCAWCVCSCFVAGWFTPTRVWRSLLTALFRRMACSVRLHRRTVTSQIYGMVAVSGLGLSCVRMGYYCWVDVLFNAVVVLSSASSPFGHRD